MSPTLAIVLLAIVFAVVGVIGLRFMAGETRRFHEEHDELERRHRKAIEAADRALEQSRQGRPTVN